MTTLIVILGCAVLICFCVLGYGAAALARNLMGDED